MAYLDQGYLRDCKDGLGGVKTLYLFPWVAYSRKDIRRSGLSLIQFPNNNIYKFEGNFTTSFTESVKFDQQGRAYEQSIVVTFTKISESYDFEKVIGNLVRAIIEDRNGKLWLVGQDNGLRSTQFQKQTGANKQELNGYNLTLTGLERLESPNLKSLDIINGFGGTWDSTLITFDSTLVTFDSF